MEAFFSKDGCATKKNNIRTATKRKHNQQQNITKQKLTKYMHKNNQNRVGVKNNTLQNRKQRGRRI